MSSRHKPVLISSHSGLPKKMLRRDRERWGMRVCQAAWRLCVSVREYRELEASEPARQSCQLGLCSRPADTVRPDVGSGTAQASIVTFTHQTHRSSF